MIWKYLTPYCTCKAPLAKNHYVIGTLMPTLVLGVGLGVVGILLANPLCFYLGFAMLLGGGGDVIIVLKLLAHKSRAQETICLDHPYECGVVVFEK